MFQTQTRHDRFSHPTGLVTPVEGSPPSSHSVPPSRARSSRDLRPVLGLLFVASLISACGAGERAVEITALREMVAETQLLVPEYQAQIAELRATTTSPMAEELPAENRLVDECRPGQTRPDDDPPIGSPSPSGEPLQAVEMRLRSGSRSDLLVPESWVLLSDDCTFNGERIWVNPVDDRERVAHVVHRGFVHALSPARDATQEINWHVLQRADAWVHLAGAVLRITEPVVCRFDFEAVADDGYVTAGIWLDIGDSNAIASITVAVATPVIDDFRDQFGDGLNWSPRDFDDYGPGPRRCHAFSETVVDRLGPVGASIWARPDGPDPLNSEIDNTCLQHLNSDYPERVQLTDGWWEADTEDIKDIRADRRTWKDPRGSGSLESTNVEVVRIAYADLLPEPLGATALEIVVGVICNANEGIHAEIQVLSSTGPQLERIGLPIDGFFTGLSSTADYYGVYKFDRSWVPERIHVSRPWIFEWGWDHVDETTLCCETDRYAYKIEWLDGAWTPVDEISEPVTSVNESAVFDSLLQVNPSLDGCSYSDLGFHVPGPFREGGGDDISMYCNFKPDGSRPTFDIDIDYPLRARAGVANPVDDHVRSRVRKHLDRRLSEDLGSSLFYGPNGTSLPSQLVVEGEVTFQSDRLYSVALPVYFYWPGAAHGANKIETVNVDVVTGQQLELADLFDPSTNWLPALLEAVDKAAEANYPRCKWRASETDPGSQLEGFNITPTHLRIYLQLWPYACRVHPVQVGYSTLADYLDPEFLNHLSAPPATGPVT